MNHIAQRNSLERQITAYVRVLKISTRSQAIKLSEEITKLASRITIIEQMSYTSQREELDFSFETKQSKLNFKTLDESNPRPMKRKRNCPENQHPIHDEAKDSRNRALQLASQHVDIKPVKYLLKN